MRNRPKITLLILALLLSAVSIIIVGLQLIGSSSDASYAIHLLIFFAAVTGLYQVARRRGWRMTILFGVFTGFLASIIPLEVLFFVIGSDKSEILLLGSAQYKNDIGEYWIAIGALFLFHSSLLSGAGALIKLACGNKKIVKAT
jgi:hypothetical protein